ncbi:MAG: VirB3 family type IV secretion system protein [Treponema sp.]|nr:VirB3 family type IV secretion system protein [Treponema sp.]
MNNKFDDETLYDYQMNVYSSLLSVKPFLGIGEAAFTVISFITVILMIAVTKLCVVIGVIAVLILRFVCKDEPRMMDFFFDNLMQSDIYTA